MEGPFESFSLGFSRQTLQAVKEASGAQYCLRYSRYVSVVVFELAQLTSVS
jgi:hypothetical protein